jgi:ATP-dependent HslUV protease ATP-binding subunit HslU
MRAMLAGGELEQRRVEMTIESKAVPVMVGGMNMEHMDVDFQGMLEKILPKSTSRKDLTVAEARGVLFEQECEALVNQEKVNAEAVSLAENSGILFVDEMDKVVASDSRGTDVSRQGVQRDLLPIVEGSTVNTKHGMVRTDHILFIASGAFHTSKPSDLIPEFQGRFPIRVELDPLTCEDFVRILTEPANALIKQYVALLRTEGIELAFRDDAIAAIADVAARVNDRTENIGARRLHTVVERLLDQISFDAPEMTQQEVVIDAAYVRDKLEEVVKDEDLSRYIL